LIKPQLSGDAKSLPVCTENRKRTALELKSGLMGRRDLPNPYKSLTRNEHPHSELSSPTLQILALREKIRGYYIKWKDNQMSLHLFVVELCGFMLMLIFISPLPKDWKLTIGVAAAIIIGIAFFTADRSKD